MTLEAGRPERNKGIEYPPERITDLVFWSFHMSQGSGLNPRDPMLVHAQIFPTLLAMHPQLAQDVHHWIKNAPWAEEFKKRDYEDEDFVGDSEIVGNKAVEAYIQRVYDYRESRAHVQGKLDTATYHREEACKALFYFLKAVDIFAHHYEQQSHEERAQEKEWRIAQLAMHIIARDAQILKDMEARESSIFILQSAEGKRLRKARGNSMFCAYALADTRKEERAFLPDEYEELWEQMGEVVRAHYAELPLVTQQQLQLLAKEYEAIRGVAVDYGG